MISINFLFQRIALLFSHSRVEDKLLVRTSVALLVLRKQVSVMLPGHMALIYNSQQGLRYVCLLQHVLKRLIRKDIDQSLLVSSISGEICVFTRHQEGSASYLKLLFSQDDYVTEFL